MEATPNINGLDSIRQDLRRYHRAESETVLTEAISLASLDKRQRGIVRQNAEILATQSRDSHHKELNALSSLLHEYNLSTHEGMLLMCIAEALLRIPDKSTQDKLIKDKLSQGKWDDHLGERRNIFINASTWGLLFSGKILSIETPDANTPERLLKQLVHRAGGTIARMVLYKAMELLAQKFVFASEINQALDKAKKPNTATYYSFDCLGEAACCKSDVRKYHAAYSQAITSVGERVKDNTTEKNALNISIKLSALHPRYSYRHKNRVLTELVPRLHTLVTLAKNYNVPITIDAEESDRLELCLDVLQRILMDPDFQQWDGIGIAVQAYQKRALVQLKWLLQLAISLNKKIPIRLVKGAYWDSEIKNAQLLGVSDYSLFTDKNHTDVMYLACAKFILSHPEHFYGQFATHNAYSIAYIQEVGANQEYEFQRLHGMGETIYRKLLELARKPSPIVRIYAPIGTHHELLPYLVRRLLENGANNSFVNLLSDDTVPIAEIIQDPVQNTIHRKRNMGIATEITKPPALYAPDRKNSRGFDLNDPDDIALLKKELDNVQLGDWIAGPIVDGKLLRTTPVVIHSPIDQALQLGQRYDATIDIAKQALVSANTFFEQWKKASIFDRSKVLQHTADLIESRYPRILARIIYEGGRTIADAVTEIREAIDHCRYYANLVENQFQTMTLSGPTGEQNRLQLTGRGVFLCISPWNFPVAIFVGQIAAALAAGNTVIAKPAEQTSLTAYYIVELFYDAGVPRQALQFLPGDGKLIGDALLRESNLAGVAFTGSTETAWTIQDSLARRKTAIIPFIAETGGINCMIVDSSALVEQAVQDILYSAFNSAGQRCSSLRVLYVQSDIAEPLIALLCDTMDEWSIGNPLLVSTDIGPVIDHAAYEKLRKHCEALDTSATLVKKMKLPTQGQTASYFVPHLYEIDKMSQISSEVFGPVLHVIRYKSDELPHVLDEINASGYGLTLGIHSRIESTWQYIIQHAKVGNIYVNRNMVGAVVGVQPFGGEGLSGTGPKTGGPHYLLGFSAERTLTINSAAIGGNAELLASL